MTKRFLSAVLLPIGLAFASALCNAAPSDCKLLKIAEWPIRLERNKLIVDGSINGQKIGIVLDTGAERSFILRSAAVRLGLTLRRARGLRLFGVGGETEVQAAQLDEFKIGEATRKNWQMIVAGEQDLGANVAVLLGDDFFHAVDVEFDLAHAAVRLFQSKDCEGVSLAYWSTHGAESVDIEPVDDAHPRVVLTVQIDGQAFRALLDSGAGTSMLATSDAAQLGVTPETPGVVAVGTNAGLGAKKIDTWIGQFQSFTIGEETIKRPRIVFSDLWKDATYTRTGSNLRTQVGPRLMLLGADFLRAHRVLIAHTQRKVYFTYAGGAMFQVHQPRDTRNEPASDAGSMPPGRN